MSTDLYSPARTHRVETANTRRLWLYGLAMLVPVLYFTSQYPFPGNLRLNDLGGMSGFRAWEFWAYVLGMAAWFGLYVLALRECRKLSPRRALGPVLGLGSVFAAVLAWMYPVTAIDIFVHVVWSRIFTVHGGNPAGIVPRDFASDPIVKTFAGGGWDTHPSPYGPLWNLISAPITTLSGDRVGLALVGLKLLAVLSLLAGAWVIVLILRELRPADAATGALFYLWNPLMLWEIAGNGHNDATMTLFLLLAFLAWAKRWYAWVVPLLVISTMVKYATALIIPLAVVAVWRRLGGDWRERAWTYMVSAVMSLGIVLVSLWPFYDLGAIRRSIEDTSRIFLISPANVIIGFLEDSYPVSDLQEWAKRLGTAILLAALVVAAAWVWRRPATLPRASFELFFIFLAIVTWYFQGWYLAWPMALAALLPWGWPAWRMIAWTAGSMSVYALFIWLRRWHDIEHVHILRIGVPMIVGAALLLTLVELLAGSGTGVATASRTEQQPTRKAGNL